MDIAEAIKNVRAYVIYDGEKMPIEVAKSLDVLINNAKLQIALKPIYEDYGEDGDEEIIPYSAKCPTCGWDFEFGTWNGEESHHCICGQAIDWEDE